MAQLLELLGQAGYDSLREARHPFGLSQRQANGKFNRTEAAELIDRLAGVGEAGPASAPPPEAPSAPPIDQPVPVAPDTVAVAFPDELLAEELTRRGWTCTPPHPEV
jgi:hypothetical protein